MSSPFKGTGNIRETCQKPLAKELQVASYSQQGTAEVGEGGDELGTSTGLRL